MFMTVFDLLHNEILIGPQTSNLKNKKVTRDSLIVHYIHSYSHKTRAIPQEPSLVKSTIVTSNAIFSLSAVLPS